MKEQKSCRKARLQQEKAKKQPPRGQGRKKGTGGAATSVTNATTTTAAVVSTPVRTVTSVPSTSTIPEVIDPNKCCMCFVTYEDDVLDVAGAEWIFVNVVGTAREAWKMW